MAATTIDRTAYNLLVDDSGLGTDGSSWDKADVNDILTAIDALFSAAGGITLNQGGGDGPILTLQSSDVAHGITAIVDTTTYGDCVKNHATQGGNQLRGFSGGTTPGLRFGAIQTTANTTKSAAAVAATMADAYIKSGTGVGASLGANTNLFAITDSGSVRFIFDAEGDSHEDGTGWTAYDAYNDVALITSLEGILSKDPLRREFRRWMLYNRKALTKARLVTFNRDGRHFINRSRLQMALCGAVRQLAMRLQAAERRLGSVDVKAARRSRRLVGAGSHHAR